jgi:lipopolysaccharide assembly outer membrane protein LptD (OstA)
VRRTWYRSCGAVLAATVLATTAEAQGSKCVFQIDNVERQGAVVETPKGTNYFAGGNVRLSCRGTQITMRSDSVASYGGSVVQFIGHVKYRDSTVTMDADRGTYYRAGERWEARGNVTTDNLKTGSTLAGPSLDYLREVPGVRDTVEMYAVSRPRIRYATADSGGTPGEPYLIVADRVRLRGNDRIWAGGKVTVDRSDFAARADSMRLDTGKGSDGTLLGGKPTLRGVGPDSFTVSGNRIDLRLDRRELTYLVAKGNARTISREWDLVADTIALDLNARKLEQTLAWGDSIRPSATSPAYALKADSLALDTPGQQLKEVRGFGKGWLGGTVYPPTKDRDWMRGDTIVARFTQADSAGRSRAVLSQIEARHAAQSYHVEPNPRFPTRPSVNYARGDVILVTVKNDSTRAVDRVDIRGKVDGIQLEATGDTTSRPKADSTQAVGAAQ